MLVSGMRSRCTVLTIWTSSTLVLTIVKDPLSLKKQSNVVYEISCSCGKVYTGKIERRLETRIEEHMDTCTCMR